MASEKTTFIFAKGHDPVKDGIMNAKSGNGTRTVTVPTWILSLLKISAPAIVVGVAMYVTIQLTEARVEAIEHKTVPALESDLKDACKKLDDRKDEIQNLKGDIRELKFKDDVIQNDLRKSIDLMTAAQQKMYDKMEIFGSVQQQIRTDVKVIEQKIKGEHAP